MFCGISQTIAGIHPQMKAPSLFKGAAREGVSHFMGGSGAIALSGASRKRIALLWSTKDLLGFSFWFFLRISRYFIFLLRSLGVFTPGRSKQTIICRIPQLSSRSAREALDPLRKDSALRDAVFETHGAAQGMVENHQYPDGWLASEPRSGNLQQGSAESAPTCSALF